MFSVSFDEVPRALTRKASIVEFKSPQVDHLAVMKLLGRLGLTERLPAFTWENHANWITAGDEQTSVSVNQLSGGFQFRLRPVSDEPKSEMSTSETKLDDIARTFLDQLGLPQDQLTLDRVTHLYLETVDAEGSVGARSTLDAGLIYTRTVEELPVIGPGGMVMVKIGTDESVVGGRQIWRPVIGRGKKLTLRTPDEATDLLQRRLKKWAGDGKLHVRKARLGYAELGIAQRQRYLEPCYAFVVETEGDTVDSKKVEVIPAAYIGPMASAFAGAVA